MGRPHRRPATTLTLGNGLSGYLDSGRNPIAGQWQHLAATYDGTTARYYIDGTEVASRAVSRQRRQLEHVADRRLRRQPRRLLRRHHRRRPHLQPRAQRRRDPVRHEPAGRRWRAAATRPRRLRPATLTATAGGRPGDAELGRRDRQRRRRPLQRPPRRRPPASRPAPANRIAQPTGTSYTDTGLAAGTYYYKVTAEDAAGNVGPASNEASATVTRRHDAAERPGDAHRRRGAIGQATLTWGAATDNVGVARYNVHRVDDRPASRRPRRTGSRSRPGTSYTDTGLAAGTYYYKVTAEDAAGNVGPASNEASATVTPTRRRRRCRSPLRRPARRSPASSNVTANATDNVGVAGVQFRVDGANLGAEDTTRAVRDRLGHPRRAERVAHAHRGRARHERQHATSSR